MKDQLKQYIDRSFSGAAKTQKNEELKEEILSNIYEKYDDFVASGMSKEEAYQATIGSIGDLSSLFEQTSEEAEKNEETAKQSPQPKREPSVPLYDDRQKARMKTFHDVGLACAVMLYIVSVCPVILWENSIWSVIGLFAIIAVATGLIIYLSCHKPILVSASLNEQQRQIVRRKRKLSAMILAGSVMLYILCVCPVILIPNEKIGVFAMFAMIGIATACIILRGTTLSLSQITNGTPSAEDHRQTPPARNPNLVKKTPSQVVFSILSGIYWALICLIYFGFSFATFRWETSWLIFLYGGLGYMITHGVFRLIIGKHRGGSIVKIVIASILLFALLSPYLIQINGKDLFSLSFGSSLIYDDSDYQVGTVTLEEDAVVLHLDIEWVEGDVAIQYWDQSYISVTEKSNREISSADQMRYQLSGSTLNIKFCSSHWYWFGDPMEKDLTVCLPRNTELSSLSVSAVDSTLTVEDTVAEDAKLTSVSGDIRVENGQFRDADFETVSGKISFSGQAKEMELDTVSGNVDLQYFNTPESIDLDSVSANFTLIFPMDFTGFTVEFDSLSGRCDCPDGTSRNEDEYEYGNQATEINCDTVSGSLTIQLQ